MALPRMAGRDLDGASSIRRITESSKRNTEKLPQHTLRELCLYDGDPAGVRTPDPLLKRQMLCRLSYRIICFFGWDDRIRTCNIRVKVWCVAITLHPIILREQGKETGTGISPNPYSSMGWVKGLEPSTPGTTIRCSNQLSYTHHILARQEGFEPPTYCLEGSCSIQLSYWRIFRA